jgi:uncharacterized membrane protein
MRLNNIKPFLFILGIVAGVVLITTGCMINDEELKSLSGVCIGIGAGLLGMFIANLVTYRMALRNPEAFAAKNREVNDERNTMIRDRAGAKTNRILMIVISIVTLIFVLIEVPQYVTLAMVSFILLNGILYIAYLNYFNRQL